MLNKKALSAAVQAAAGGATYVEDVFSTYIYNGTGSTLSIVNGIDLSTKGGLVWTKDRSSLGGAHRLVDSARGVTKSLTSTSTGGQVTESTGLTAFNTDGFTLSSDGDYNSSSEIFASWTFRKAAKFFDVVTYSGTGTAKTVNHNLGSVPGCIIVKRTDSADDWAVYHRSLGASKWVTLNTTNAENTGSTPWNDTSPTSTQFTVGTATYTNANGGTYVAYLFAHDAGGFGDDGTDNVISCGSYTGNGNIDGPTVTLNWEPQWILIKSVGNNDWLVYDSFRGLTVGGTTDYFLKPNLSDVEANSGHIGVLPTGFKLTSSATFVNGGNDYIYIAIRRGPMKTPTDATKVFTPTVYTGTNVDNRLINTTIAPDFVMIRQRNDTVIPGMYTGARLTGQEFLITGSTDAGATDIDSFDAQSAGGTERGNAFSSMSGVWVGNDATRKFNANTTSNNHVIHAFKRAPGFFDVVCYTGTGSNTTVSHNLGVAPEMMWIKARVAPTVTGDWLVYAQPIGNTDALFLNTNDARVTQSSYWNNTSPTSSSFAVGTNGKCNESAKTYVAFLFASCPGVSKVGSYTCNGSNQTIDCGFTAGARFVLIKRTDVAGDWYLFDTARGIVSASDPFILLNSTAAENTANDAVDTDSTGFVVNQVGSINVNVTSGTYIYLAIA